MNKAIRIRNKMKNSKMKRKYYFIREQKITINQDKVLIIGTKED